MCVLSLSGTGQKEGRSRCPNGMLQVCAHDTHCWWSLEPDLVAAQPAALQPRLLRLVVVVVCGLMLLPCTTWHTYTHTWSSGSAGIPPELSLGAPGCAPHCTSPAGAVHIQQVPLYNVMRMLF